MPHAIASTTSCVGKVTTSSPSSVISAAAQLRRRRSAVAAWAFDPAILAAAGAGASVVLVAGIAGGKAWVYSQTSVLRARRG